MESNVKMSNKKLAMDENRLQPCDLEIHDWYRFVLSFPPHLVRQYFNLFNITSKDIVLDPFCGTGTTNVECLKNGIPSIGIEANPIAWFASSVKASINTNVKCFYQEAGEIALKSERAIRSTKNLLELPQSQQKLILKNSICPKPLSDVLILRNKILEKHSIYENYFLLALAKHIVQSYSNLKFGPEVGVSRKRKTDVDVVSIWLNQIEIMKKDIIAYSDYSHTDTKIIKGDARYISSLGLTDKVTAVITSPPYPNEKDYSRTTRLESVILGFIQSKDDLRNSKKMLIRSNTKNIYKNDTDDLFAKKFPDIVKLSDTIERKRIELGKTSGFERLYSRVVLTYFGGIYKHLQELRSVLKLGAHLAYVVGDQASYFQIPIRTSVLISEMASSLGYRTETTDVFRTRFATGSGKYLNEDVLILTYVGGNKDEEIL